MGTDSSKPAIPPVTHEQIVNIINASSMKTKEHAEKTATSVELIAYIMLIVVISIAVFGIYKLITRYERMRTTLKTNKATSLASVRATVI